MQYDLACGQPKIKQGAKNICYKKLVVNEKIEAPIYVYYQLENFYQNHRRYVKSRDYKQLMGEERTTQQLKDTCDPIVTNSQLGFQYAYDGVTELDPDAPAHPCGLVAKSLFNDTYHLFDFKPEAGENEGQSIPIDAEEIAWESDVKYKFKNLP